MKELHQLAFKIQCLEQNLVSMIHSRECDLKSQEEGSVQHCFLRQLYSEYESLMQKTAQVSKDKNKQLSRSIDVLHRKIANVKQIFKQRNAQKDGLFVLT